MHTQTILAATLASLCIAAPAGVARRQTSSNFVMVSTHSGNENVHLRSIAANGERFWLGLATATFCPSDVSGLDCSTLTNSITAVAGDAGTATSLAMDGIVPGGQEVYVTADGQLGYTAAHANGVPVGAVATPFLYTPEAAAGEVGSLEFNAAGFEACPDAEAGEDVYQVYAAGVEGFVRTDCISIGVVTATYTGSPAWEYD